MSTEPQISGSHRPGRRADAARSIARILDAAADALAADPEASVGEIARRAGLVRATVYVHFSTREALLEAVTERALAEGAAAIEAAEPERGDPEEALRRVIAAAWRTLGRYHGLVAVNTSTRTSEELRHGHASVLGSLRPLIERGQASGAFRDDVPEGWHLSMILALVHAGSAEVRARRATEAQAEAALVATVVGAVGASG